MSAIRGRRDIAGHFGWSGGVREPVDTTGRRPRDEQNIGDTIGSGLGGLQRVADQVRICYSKKDDIFQVDIVKKMQNGREQE